MAPEGAGPRDDSAIVCSHVSGSPAPETKIIKSSSQRAVMVPGLSWFQSCHGSRVQGCHGSRVVMVPGSRVVIVPGLSAQFLNKTL